MSLGYITMDGDPVKWLIQFRELPEARINDWFQYFSSNYKRRTVSIFVIVFFMRGTAGEARTNSKVTFSYGPLYGYLPPISQTIQVRRTRLAVHSWRIKDEHITDVLQWTLAHGRTSVSWPARTYLYQTWRTQDVAWKTSRERWMIWTDGERGLRKSMPAAWLINDNDFLWSLSIKET